MLPFAFLCLFSFFLFFCGSMTMTPQTHTTTSLCGVWREIIPRTLARLLMLLHTQLLLLIQYFGALHRNGLSRQLTSQLCSNSTTITTIQTSKHYSILIIFPLLHVTMTTPFSNGIFLFDITPHSQYT